MIRRDALKAGALGAAATLVGGARAWAAPTILTPRRTRPRTAAGTLRFRPTFVQEGRGPYLLDWAYASDENGDTFRSDVTAAVAGGVAISDAAGHARFGINVKWFVEGVGNLFLTADNGGDFYALPPEGQERTLSLNDELARSRVMRNRRRLARHAAAGYAPSREVRAHLDLAEGYAEDAARAPDEARRGALAQQALLYAIRGAELMETDAAAHAIAARAPRDGFFFGCDARAFYQMRTPELFTDLFTQAFNFAPLTYVWEHPGVIGDFERTEGAYNFEFRDALIRRLRQHGVTMEGRPILWFHTWVTPDWIKAKSFDELKRYTERTVRAVVGHYAEREIYAWEIVNEFHDWANEVGLDPEQTVELTKLACEVAKDTDPRVRRLVNNCCPFAEYVQLGQWSGWPNQPARFRQRTPWQFTRDLVDAGVDFDLVGQQMYFPERDLQDIAILTERYAAFGKPLHYSEVGCPGGPSDRSVRLGTVPVPDAAYDWHAPWSEDVQANWLEAVYTLAYSQPFTAGAHWFDFVDDGAYIPNGGLFRSPEGEPKEAFRRLQALQRRWGAGPARDSVPPPVPGAATGVGSTGGSTCTTC